MAYIRAKKKKEKIVSYEFSCFLGRDEKGKQIRRSITWYVPKDLSQSKGRKAAEKAAQVWEEEVRAEYEKDLQNPKRIAIKEVANEKTHFEDFVNDIWFPICIDNGEHKISTVSFYRQTADSVINYFSGYSLQSMNIFALKKFFVFLKKEKAYSAQYRHHHYRVLNMVFDFAVPSLIEMKEEESIAFEKVDEEVELFGLTFTVDKLIIIYSDAKINNIDSVKRSISKKRNNIMITIKPKDGEKTFSKYYKFEGIRLKQ